MPLNLDLRTPGIGPVFVGTYAIGGPINSPWEPEPGNTVTLRSGKMDITAKIVQAEDRSYKGTVVGFETRDEVVGELGDELEYEGTKLNDEIEFGYQHLIACTR